MADLGLWEINSHKIDEKGGVIHVDYSYTSSGNEGRGRLELYPNHESETFVQYSNVSNQLILQWVHNSIDKSTFESEVNNDNSN